ncbi:MAG: hypothetical protein COA43_01205 [Robiginitomaculum sp.]|nr:MAG: hypothetical protein COA43_01205 [Robiginitomaculum sp.]
MSEFTKGPWRANVKCLHPDMGGNHQMTYSIRIPCNSVGRTIHTIWLGGGRINDTKIVAANAHLIAAAPDMYEALERAKVFIENGIEFGYIQLPEQGDPALETPKLISTALAKAKGE